MRYVRYARKSEADDGRQEKSIEQQREIMQDDARQHGLVVVKEIEEAVSAKLPGKRKGYQEMIAWLKQGRADAILVYHVNRLARNPLESGELQQLLQDGVIKEIRTHETVYRPEDNALLFSVISSMANQYSRDLSTHVLRGMNGKRAEGWYPHRAPEGYLNNLADHTIEADPERFPLLRQAWELMLTGSYSIAQVLQIMNQEWGYVTRATKKCGGGPLSRSALYRIFTNVFYTGRWKEKGVLYQGKHPPMITVSEFNHVQEILGRPGKAQRKIHAFAYAGLIRCTGCGCAVTAELQRGRHGRGTYIYYHCSNVRRQCRRVSISERQLEQQIDSLLQSITISSAVEEVALQEIRSWQKQESGERETIFAQQQKALLEAERKMNKLVQMYLNELFDSDEEYRALKTELQAEINRLKLQVESSQEEFARITQTAENAFHFAAHARENFLLGDLNRKREIARALGLNYSFYEGQVTIELHPALAAIYDLKQSLEIACIEPRIISYESAKADAFASAVPLGWANGTLYETFNRVSEYFSPMVWILPPDHLTTGLVSG
jgi:site-specific DNA recombinase